MLDKPGHMLNSDKKNENAASFCKISKIPANSGHFFEKMADFLRPSKSCLP